MKTLRDYVIEFLTQDGLMAILSISVLFLNALGLLTHNVWLIRIFLLMLLAFGAFLFSTGCILFLTMIVPDRILDSTPLASICRKVYSRREPEIAAMRPASLRQSR